MPSRLTRHANHRHALMVLVLALLTLGVVLAQHHVVERDLAQGERIAAFERARQTFEDQLSRLDNKPPSATQSERIRESWVSVQHEASQLAAELDAPAVLGALARADAALTRALLADPRVAQRARNGETTAEALADGARALQEAALDDRAAALARYRMLALVTLLILVAGACWLILPSMRRLARIETEAKQAEARLNYLAYHDELTALANRRGLNRRLAELAERPDARFGLVLCDLDGFKPINDVFGHDAGDAVLKAVAGRLENGLRPDDLAARIGGDEFVLVIADADDPNTIGAIAQRLRERLAHPVRHGPHQLRFGASLGTALFPEHGANTNALISAADAAMYEAKQAGGQTVRRYTRALRERDEMRHEIAYELEAAIANGALGLALQPQLELATGRIMGFEALARWHSGTRGRIAPDVFIPMAESAGLLTPLTHWLLKEVEQRLLRWRLAHLPPVQISVNIAATGLVRDDLVEALCRVGRHRDPQLGRIGIEIAEDAMFGRNAEAVLESLNTLHEHGVGIAIDDFGTGYASLSHLAQIPFGHLKIPGSFIRQLEHGANSAAVVGTVIELAQRFGGRSIATCVETTAQLDLLSAGGCDVVQGFVVAPPLTCRAAEQFLQRTQVESQVLISRPAAL